MRRHLCIAIVFFAAWTTAAPAQNVPLDTGDGSSRGKVSPSVPRDYQHFPTNPPARGEVGYGPMPTGNNSLYSNIPYSGDPGVWDETTWISWWETNREAILRQYLRRHPATPSATPTAATPAAPATKSPERDHAAAALLKATHADQPALRASAAVSLGQMRQEDSLKRLAELAHTDPDPYVRGMSWLAVGLIGNAEAEKAITTTMLKTPVTEFEELGEIAGIGMLDHPSEPTFQLLHSLASKPPTTEIGRMAMWAMRVNHRTADHDFIYGLLTHPPVATPIASEGLLALGAIGDVRDVDFIADAASAGQAANAPNRVVVNGGGGVSEHPRTFQYPSQINATGGVTTPLVYRPPAQVIASRSSFARVSAALALGMNDTGHSLASSSIQAQNALILNFASYLDQGGPIYAGASLVSFSTATAENEIYVVRDILDMGTDPTVGLVNPRSPLRGFAALGLGLYMANGGPSKIATRPIGGVAPVGFDQSLPDYLDLNETLALRYTNRQESSELRAACALALGLSGDPANAQRLLKGAQSINPRDELLMGYTTLALGLLHERSLLNAAAPLTAGSFTKIDVQAVAARGIGQLWATPGIRRASATGPSDAELFEAPAVPQSGPGAAGVIGRRAALLGIAFLDDPRSETLLAGAWARDRSTVQDVARAMSWCHTSKLAEPLAQLIDLDKKGAPEAAMTLGWIFDPDHPSRLNRLVSGNNYHQPQTDYVPLPGGSIFMLRNYPRVADLYLYSSPFGGHVLPPRRLPTTAPAR